MAANDKNVALADAAWKQVFEAGPYTAVIMLDYLRVQANMANWGDVLKSKYSKNKGFEALRPVMAKKDVMAQDAKSLTQIWDSQPGRCTSFAVKVTSMLETKAPNTFKFNIYDIGRHRVARCEKTGILIDSSAVQGAFELPEGNWIRMEGSEASWKWSKGKSKFERNVDSSGIKESKTIITKEAALVTCLLELPEAPSIPTLFRSIDPTTKKAAYHAMIKWVWKDKSLEVFPSLGSKDYYIVKFGGGTDVTNAECLKNLLTSLERYGGPHHAKQWASVQVANLRIWEGAVEAWGKPQWVTVQAPVAAK